MNNQLKAQRDHKSTEAQKELKQGGFTFWLNIFASCIIFFGLMVSLIALGIAIKIQSADAQYSIAGAVTAYTIAGSTFLGTLFTGLPLGALAEISKKLSNPK